MNIQETLKKMALKEKIALCSGENFWETKAFPAYDIPSVFMCDGPHGLRKQEDEADMLGINRSAAATCFPTAVTTGASWNPALMEAIGEALGAEAAEKKVSLVLGPGANIKRNPLCGRNFEYISEDPYLTGKMAAGMIRGLQKNGTAASLKHFACNNQEKSRFNSNSVMDERTLREIYLTGFEIAVKEGKPDTVMSAYPKLNGVHCSDSRKLLTDILRQEWGFDGLVVTDWGGMNDRIKAFQAGCDLCMPGGSDYMEAEALAAVKNGRLSEQDIDASASRMLRLLQHAAEQKNVPFEPADHHALACKAAEEGAVLLKNDHHLLPLKPGQSIACVGVMARVPRYQGAGSSHINPYQVTALTDVLSEAVYAPGCCSDGSTTEELLQEAETAARNTDVAVVVAGLPEAYESEGFDRETMHMPDGHEQMIRRVSAVNPNTVVVLCCGSAVACPWAEDVSAILYMGLPGEAGGEAAARLLTGAANPSGKLTETWPMTYADCPSSEIYGQKDALYQEGLYVGYRYYDTAHVSVRWPFGYGLSYTTFAYSDLRCSACEASVTVTNTGTCAGAEVVQLYVHPPKGGIHRPARELKAFKKVYLQPGESQVVTLLLNERSFAVWKDGWVVPEGRYTLQISGLSASVEICGSQVPVPAWQPGSWYAQPEGKPSSGDWEALLGYSYRETPLRKGCFTMDNSVEEMKAYSLVMRIMYKATESVVAKGFNGKKDYQNPEFRMLMASSAGSPLRSMQISGGIKGGLFKGLLEMANGHYLRGIRVMLKKERG